VAYRTKAWKALGHGRADVAEDYFGKSYYGKREAVWLRLRHRATLKVVFFVNHHGPLPIDSGGQCGGEATAYNLLHLIEQEAHEGDAVILVGDFNADTWSATVQTLMRVLHKVASGASFGGIDNILSNTGAASTVSTQVLRHGGSDHHALEAVLAVHGPAPSTTTATATATTTTMRNTTSTSKRPTQHDMFVHVEGMLNVAMSKGYKRNASRMPAAYDKGKQRPKHNETATVSTTQSKNAKLAAQRHCSDNTVSCMDTRCCEDPEMRCFKKDQWWASCRANCTPGTVRIADPQEKRTPWACIELGPAKGKTAKITVLSAHRSELSEIASRKAGHNGMEGHSRTSPWIYGLISVCSAMAVTASATHLWQWARRCQQPNSRIFHLVDQGMLGPDSSSA